VAVAAKRYGIDRIEVYLRALNINGEKLLTRDEAIAKISALDFNFEEESLKDLFAHLTEHQPRTQRTLKIIELMHLMEFIL
jgi:hypothetical protein